MFTSWKYCAQAGVSTTRRDGNGEDWSADSGEAVSGLGVIAEDVDDGNYRRHQQKESNALMIYPRNRR